MHSVEGEERMVLDNMFFCYQPAVTCLDGNRLGHTRVQRTLRTCLVAI